MLRLTTRRVVRPSSLRRLHHDIPRPGIVFPVVHIDIGPAAQPSQKHASEHATASSSSSASHPTPSPSHWQEKPPKSPISINVQRTPGDANTPGKVAVDVKVDLRFWLPLILVLTLVVGTRFDQLWPSARIERAARFLADAPDVDVLKDDPEALDAQLTALLQTLLLPNALDMIPPALRHWREQGEAGHEVILRCYSELRGIILDDGVGVWKKTVRMAAVLSAFVERAKKIPGGAPPPSESSELLADMPELNQAADKSIRRS
ncbi:hypothetical protein R3P38DRAFT_2879208 [Favolaschia claudopus]|uniref:Uncharacterized protein n=1 Tax=Favolaschia claudopus TaxID=2862362 RepID=A0AAW0CWG2_9AGAR